MEFLDLTTVRRTITLTLDLDQLARVRTTCSLMSGGPDVVPLGWFVPWANAGTALVDADERMLPYLTSEESDREVERQIRRRLAAVGLNGLDAELQAVPQHRSDPGSPGDRCDPCGRADCTNGHRELMIDKWGCRMVLELLELLQAAGPDRDDVRELARILLAWQRNFVLFACIADVGAQRGHAMLRLSYDEELLEWEPPWEQRRRLVREPERRACRQPVECRAYVSRGGPFSEDLDRLAPGGVHGMLARSCWPRLRKMGRRGLLHPVWHVAWHQASGMDVADHHVDVVLPNELAAVRMRMLRMFDGRRWATIADQAGSRPTIVAPRPRPDGPPTAATPNDEPGPWSPTLFSLVLTQRSAAAWFGGAWTALLTAIALIVVGSCWMKEVAGHAEPTVAALLLAPTLVAAVLSVRAGSEIAEQLTTMLRRLIALVSIAAATCAIAVIVGPDPNGQLWWTRGVWLVAGLLLLTIAGALFKGARRIECLLARAWLPAPRYLGRPDVGNVLNRPDTPRIGPPDCWLNADEGDLVPWGWLDDPCNGTPRGSDAAFWKDARSPARLVEWVCRSLRYTKLPSDEPSCPQCRC